MPGNVCWLLLLLLLKISKKNIYTAERVLRETPLPFVAKFLIFYIDAICTIILSTITIQIYMYCK